MVKGIPKELTRKEYQKLSIQERKDLWARIVSERLEISEEEARLIIKRNNMHPLWEVQDKYDTRDYLIEGEHHLLKSVKNRKIYPRFNANAMLLARLSSDYRGPRGPRPIFASLENIARISVENPTAISYWRKSLGKNWEPVGQQLVDLQLTAANPHRALEGVEFSFEDIRKGVYIPSHIDKKTAKALGIIYSDGHIARTSLRLTGSTINLQFYNDVVIPTIEDTFNLLQDNVYKITQPSGFTERDYTFLRLNYSSKALTTYLVNHFGFRRSEEERREKGLSSRMKEEDFKQYIHEFLKFFLASASSISLSYNLENIAINISDVSRPMLDDIGKLLEDMVEKPSINLHPHNPANSYILSISTVPTLELFFSGLLNENPRIRGKIQSYLEEYGIGRRAFKHLHQLFGDSIVQYRR